MPHKHDALFVMQCFQLPHADDMYHLVGRVLSGFIFDDTKQEGNHPFPQCHYIDTSNLQQVIVEKGNTYLITRNTTYLLIGAGTNPETAQRVFTSYKDALSKHVSLTGDPVD